MNHVLDYFLQTVTKPYHWSHEGAGDLATKPILSAASTLDICPGVEAQGLHRDDFIWQQTHIGGQKSYMQGADVGMGLLVPGVKTSAANGATLVSVLFLPRQVVGRGAFVHRHAKLFQFVPGSHLWDHSRLPKLEDAVPAEMEVGEAFLFLASAVHAGGANTTSQDRIVHGFFFCRAYLRPEVCFCSESSFLFLAEVRLHVANTVSIC